MPSQREIIQNAQFFKNITQNQNKTITQNIPNNSNEVIKNKVVIIGAGVAGINAATKLVDNGYPGELIMVS